MLVRGLTQDALAEKIGIRQPSLSAILTGETKRTKHLPAIARALGCQIEWLETGDGPIEASVAEPSDALLSAIEALTVLARQQVEILARIDAKLGENQIPDESKNASGQNTARLFVQRFSDEK